MWGFGAKSAAFWNPDSGNMTASVSSSDMNLVGDEDSLQDIYNKKLAMWQFLPQRKAPRLCDVHTRSCGCPGCEVSVTGEVARHASCTQHRPFSAWMGAIVTIIWTTCFLPGLLAFVPTCFWFILLFVVSPDSKTQRDNETGLALRRLLLRCSGRCMVALIIMALGLPETYLWPNMISLEITIKWTIWLEFVKWCKPKNQPSHQRTI
jgi:hypothetical protein